MEKAYPGQVYCPICTHTVSGEVKLTGPNWKRVPKVVPGTEMFAMCFGAGCGDCAANRGSGLVIRTGRIVEGVASDDESVKVYTVEDVPVTMVPCVVCGSDAKSIGEEKLCWVCKRLKISAWRDSEMVPAQE